MLRCKKDQVAQDLPDKTEVVLWCTMGREQRAVYEQYKNYYRGGLLKKLTKREWAPLGEFFFAYHRHKKQTVCGDVKLPDKLTYLRDSRKLYKASVSKNSVKPFLARPLIRALSPLQIL